MKRTVYVQNGPNYMQDQSTWEIKVSHVKAKNR